ncbi:hypothetical protein JHK82_022995 [Glycine max]|nr:hypothetical protein JHK82_022995 [Glycine max]
MVTGTTLSMDSRTSEEASAMKVLWSVLLHLSFDIHFMPPLHIQTCARPPTTSITYVFIVDVTHLLISRPSPLFLPPNASNLVDALTQYMTVQRSSGRRHIWRISMHNGL